MVKVIAHFDLAGKIHSAVSYEGGPGIGLTLSDPHPGLHSAEIAHGLSAVPAADQLHELARSHPAIDPAILRTIHRIP